MALLPSLIDRETRAHLDVHLGYDNYATQKHVKIRARVARNPRIHLHFTRTYAAWLAQGE